MRRIADVNQQFHRLILTSAGSRRLVNALSGLSRVPLLMGVVPDAYTEAMRRSLGHHREIVLALRARDPSWAESIMQAHIKAARAARREDRLSWPFSTS
ncbi:MAG: FCD domain-containing protein [Pseudonocardiaceae bacterium]|nr:FCD domain-containing protein [Pseudonocardiaceae bacterium]